MKQWQKLGLIGLVIAGIFWWWRAGQTPAVPVAEQQKPVDAITETDWYLGNPNALVQVIEYSDLQCPACQFYKDAGRMIAQEFGDSVGFAFRHFPLRQIHRNANLAAQAAEAAGKQNKFWEMEELLFEKQREWENSNQAFILFAGYAQELNLNADDFRRDIDSAEVKAQVEADYLSALVSKIDATPTFFINGQKVNNLRGPDDLVTRVRFALEEATASASVNGE
jgi:protein-disulfide isomerase